MQDDTNESLNALLKRVMYFADLDSETRQLIAGAVVRREYEPEQIVFLEGEPSSGLYVVEHGWLKVVKLSADGREQILRFVGPEEVFNEVGAFVQASNPATVIALEPAVVCIIRREMMLQLLDTHPRLARRIIEKLAEHLQYLIGLVEDLSMRTVEGRLARYLLEQATDSILYRPRWSTQAEIARRLGTVPDVLHRVLRALAEDNIIRVERQQIEILDRTRLERLAQIEPH